MVSLPNLDRYRRAAAKDDRFIVVSEAYPDAHDGRGGRRPARGDVARARGHLRERRAARCSTSSGWSRRPATRPSDAWQMIEVARRLGFEKLFPYEPARSRRADLGGVPPLPCGAAERAAAPRRAARAAGRDVAVRGRTRDPVALQHRARPGGRSRPRRLRLLRPRRTIGRGSGCDPTSRRPSRRTATYPFWLTTGAVLEHWGAGSMTQRIPTLHRALPHAYVEINREDAARPRHPQPRDRAPGEPARLARARGPHRLPLPAAARPGLRPVVRRGAAGEPAHARCLLPALGAARWRQVCGARGAAVGRGAARESRDRHPTALALRALPDRAPRSRRWPR